MKKQYSCPEIDFISCTTDTEVMVSTSNIAKTQTHYNNYTISDLFKTGEEKF